jgi:hypothetical protein
MLSCCEGRGAQGSGDFPVYPPVNSADATVVKADVGSAGASETTDAASRGDGDSKATTIAGSEVVDVEESEVVDVEESEDDDGCFRKEDRSTAGIYCALTVLTSSTVALQSIAAMACAAVLFSGHLLRDALQGLKRKALTPIPVLALRRAAKTPGHLIPPPV